MSQSRSYSTLQFLRKLKNKGNSYAHFDNDIIHLQQEAVTNGFQEETLNYIFKVITETSMNVKKRIALLKCLVPEQYFPEELVKNVVEWFIIHKNTIPVSLFTNLVTWIIGILEYEIVNEKWISIYYDVFFLILLTHKQVSIIARLIYIMTKPENVTRRQVLRILRLQLQVQEKSKVWKKLNAILSLFKTYKPDCVPENIKAMNFQSIWNKLPEDLQGRFEAVKKRIDKNVDNNHIQFVNINAEIIGNRKTESLVPFINYLHYDNKRWKNSDTISIFDLKSVEDIGRYYQKIDLPSQAVSLLTNLTGCHLLAFSDHSYQNRFMYILYNTLRKAFFIEEEKFQDEERAMLLKKITLFCQYIQEGIPAVNYFLQEYLLLRNGFSQKILDLLSWSFAAPKELYDSILKYIKMMFNESSVKEKCAIFKMLSKLMYNTYVSKCYDLEFQSNFSLFLKLRENENIMYSILAITSLAEELAVSGLLAHSFHAILLSEMLSFYEQVAILQYNSKVVIWTIAPPSIIYGCFTSTNISILSRLCKLLTSYDETFLFVKAKGLQNEYVNEINLLNFYKNDLVECLLNDKAFNCKNNKNRLFLKHFPASIIQDLKGHAFDELLNIANHCAVLPHCITTLTYDATKTFNISTGMIVACHYYPDVCKFIELIKKT